MNAEKLAGLRAWAKGIYPYEAGAELLIRHGLADRMDVAGFMLDHDRDPEVSRGYVWPDVAGFAEAGPGLSGSERRILGIAGTLLGVEGFVIDSDSFSSLDRTNMALVLAAFSHANGSHEHRDTSAMRKAMREAMRTGARTLAWDPPSKDERLPPLYPWPESQGEGSVNDPLGGVVPGAHGGLPEEDHS